MKSKSSKLALAVGVMALSLGGCANTLRGGPERIYAAVEGPSSDSRFSNLKAAIQNHCYNLGTTNTTSRAARNKLSDALMLLADRRYYEFELSISNESRGGTFATSLASIGLTSAAALSGESAAQVLATIDTGLKGASQAYSKDFLFDQTIPALQNQMRASRAKLREQILERNELSIEKWSTCKAVTDIIAYEHAGTLVGAIVDITAASGEEQIEAEKDLEETVKLITAACDVINPEAAMLNLRFRNIMGTQDGENPELRRQAAERLGVDFAEGTVPTWLELANAFDQNLCDDVRKREFLENIEITIPTQEQE